MQAPVIHRPMTATPREFSRRDFLGTTARLGTALLVAPAILRAAETGAPTINVGLIGCGEEGRILPASASARCATSGPTTAPTASGC
jgi:hypothetical protein